MKRGKFIVLEGADGSGKQTQRDLLYKRIKKDLKQTPFKIDFPQYDSSFFGALAGRFLKGEFGGLKEVDPHLASLPYAADRWQAKDKILKQLLKGKTVLANRYALSNMAHQTAKLPKNKRNKFINFLLEMEYEIFKIPREDLNIFLSVSPRVGQKLVDKKGERKYVGGKARDIHESDLEYQKECLKMYKSLARRFPEKIVMIECSDKSGSLRSIDEIHEEVWKITEKFLKNGYN